MRKRFFISEKSLVKDAKVGRGVKIWHYCNIYGCAIGENTQIGSFCEIKPRAVIGKNCRLQSYVFVPEGTFIGDNVFIGPGVVFANDKYPSAIKAISGNWKEDAAVIESHTVLGAGATICAGVRIGESAIVGAGSCVTKDVKPCSIVCGNPAKRMGDIRDKKYSRLYKELVEASCVGQA